MKSISITVFLASALVGPVNSTESPTLLSVYDGWGTHYIPGFGKVSAMNALQCGKVRVLVRAIENSEERDSPLTAARIQDIRAINAATLASLASAGNACPKPPFSAEA